VPYSADLSILLSFSKHQISSNKGKPTTAYPADKPKALPTFSSIPTGIRTIEDQKDVSLAAQAYG
jgi:hypothetical protein